MTTSATTDRHFISRPTAEFGFAEILYAKGDGVARITINRPQNYNAYSTAALQELGTQFADHLVGGLRRR